MSSEVPKLTDETIKNINTLEELLSSVKENDKDGTPQAMNILYKMARSETEKRPPAFTIDIDTNNVKLPQSKHPETNDLTYHIPLGNAMNVLGNVSFQQFLSNTDKLTIVHPDPPFWFHTVIEFVMRSMENPEGKRVARIPAGWKTSENCAVTKFYKIIISLMEINNWWDKIK